MLIRPHNRLALFFGDASTGFIPSTYQKTHTFKTLIHEQPFAFIKHYGADALYFLRQTHSASGLKISTTNLQESPYPFSLEGDFMITNAPGIGLGIITADCLPIVIYDTKNNSLGVVHAGWRGSVKEIILKALAMMLKQFASTPADLTFFFGPSAQRCCYTVGQEVIDALRNFSYYQQIVDQKEGHYFFDLPLFNQLQLISVGIHPQQLHTEYTTCTIHNQSFHSYRRNKTAQRQATIAFLIE